MDVRKANIKFLLGKVRTYLDAEPDAKKKGKRYMEARKALARLEKLFSGEIGRLELRACKSSIRVVGG